MPDIGNDSYTDNDFNEYEEEMSRHDDDEQHTQKLEQQRMLAEQSLNKKIILLEEDCKRLRKELQSEKEAHEATKNALDGPQGKGSAIPESVRNLIEKLAKSHSVDVPKKSSMNTENCTKILEEILSKPVKSHSRMGTSNSFKGTDGGDDHLKQRISNLEDELRLALGAAEDIRALKGKLMQMVERNRLEKESKIKCQNENSVLAKRVEMLTEHMEKLVIHLRHEGSAKIRISENLRDSEKETVRLKEKCDLISRKSSAKDKLILELREGSKVLEDQLRLMDEKFLELRTKLDWAREQGNKKVKKAEKVARDLRTKFALAGNISMLDSVTLPTIQNSQVLGEAGFDENEVPWGGSSQLTNKTRKNKRGPNPNRSRKGTTSNSTPNLFGSTISDNATPEENLGGVLEKIRLKNGGKQDWSEERIRELSGYKTLH